LLEGKSTLGVAAGVYVVLEDEVVFGVGDFYGEGEVPAFESGFEDEGFVFFGFWGVVWSYVGLFLVCLF
jgi:hypothetical protein